MIFSIGQRWMSETEPELGLGLIISLEQKRVSLIFPAAESERTYGVKSAPLKRVIFQKGDELSLSDGQPMVVEEVETRDELVFYQIAGEWYPEAQVAATMSFNRPQDRLLNGQLDSPELFYLRYLTLKYQKDYLKDPVRGLMGPKIGLLPHQFYVAKQVASRPLPRVLLADEVGLGKTIEAGMIIHQLICQNKAERILILTPRTLIHQWFVEMLRRFNLPFSVMDSDDQFDPGTNPFQMRQKMISSIQLLMGSELAREFALKAQYDVIIVDEAHLLKWSQEGASPEYLLVEQLAQKTPGLLLLTATPEQLGDQGHFARLKLLDPHRFTSLENFIEDQKKYHLIAEIARKVLEKQDFDPQEEKFLQDFLPSQTKDPQSILSELIDAHGTGRIYYRNSRAHIGQEYHYFTKRIPLPCPLGQDIDPQDPHLSQMSFQLHLEFLLRLLKDLNGEKILLICRSKEKVMALEEGIRQETNIKTAIFHSGLNLSNRDRQAAYFTDPQGAQILLCTEMGSEGRNFQFAHHLVLFDLPTDPNLLEQRIGRLDRIGQSHQVSIHIPYVVGTYEEVLYQWYEQGLNAFRKTPAGAHLLKEKVQELLDQSLKNPQLGWDQLIQDSQKYYQEIQADLEKGRDRLIEIHSFNKTEGQQLTSLVRQKDQSPQLKNYMELVFHNLGVDSEDLDGVSEFLRPHENMFVPHFPELPREGVAITFDRAKALEREEIQFLTWDHPMVTGVMDLILSSELGNACACVWQDRPLLSPILLELLYVWEAIGPKNLNLGQYAPPSGIRILLSLDGKNLAKEISFEALQQQIRPASAIEKQTLGQIPKEGLIGLERKGYSLAKSSGEKIGQKYKQDLEKSLKPELQRLRYLHQTRKSVGAEEILALENQIQAIETSVLAAQVRLDSLRFIFPTPS